MAEDPATAGHQPPQPIPLIPSSPVYNTPTTSSTPRANIRSSPAPKDIRLRPHLWGVIKRNVIWRIVSTSTSMVLVLCTIYGFAGKNALTSDDRRWFNALAILFSALVSLSVGSLLNFLGAMIRWPLLAGRSHSTADVSPVSKSFVRTTAEADRLDNKVDLILGMSDPVGSFHLLWSHTKSLRWTKITVVALLYLLFNIIGRLSVAGFGLTFDLNEVDGIEYPVKVTSWDTSRLANAPNLTTLSLPFFYNSEGFQSTIGTYVLLNG